MDEKFKKKILTAEERLKQLNEERKNLKAQVSSERETRLKEAAKMRVFRDSKLEKFQEKLKRISEAIYAYNKLGKVAKMDCDIFRTISEEINSSDEEEKEEDTSDAIDASCEVN